MRFRLLSRRFEGMAMSSLATIICVLAIGGCSPVANEAPLEVSYDPSGRPYDAKIWAEGTEQRFLTEFQIVDGQLRVMDGLGIHVGPVSMPSPDMGQPVDFGATELVELSIVWEQTSEAEQIYEAPLGVRLDVPGKVVERWGAFEYAYGTDGGLGAITSAQILIDPTLDQSQLGEEFFLEFDDYMLYDFNGDSLNESIIFSNGWGDGGFPMTRGFAADDSLASLMVWDPRYPWRLAVPDGIPPPDIIEREEELLECIAGRRGVDSYGYCHSDIE